MEPISALLTIAGAYGVGALVKALSGSSDLGAVTAEIFKALRESESHIDLRLTRIENRLDNLERLPYRQALGAGVRYLLDADAGDDRSGDLDDARNAFVQATFAASSSLQRAVAYRYLMVTAVAQGRVKGVPDYLNELEHFATSAAFEAMVLTEWTKTDYDLIVHGQSRSGDYDAPSRQEALDSMQMCGRLLGEAAVLAPEFGLPPRVQPPTQVDVTGIIERQPAGVASRAAYRASSKLARSEPADPLQIPLSPTRPYWAFEMSSSEPFRIGCLTLELQSQGRDEQPRSTTCVANLRTGYGLANPTVMHLMNAEYNSGYSNRVQPWTPPGAPKPPRMPELRPRFLGWSAARPPIAVQLDAETIGDVSLPRRPTVKLPGDFRHLDTSKNAIRLNPAHTLQSFIVIAMPVRL